MDLLNIFEGWISNHILATRLIIMGVAAILIYLQSNLRAFRIIRNERGVRRRKIIARCVVNFLFVILAAGILPAMSNSLSDTKKELERMQEYEILYNSASSLNKEGNYLYAAQKWKELVIGNKENAVYHEGYGIALYYLERYEEAEEEFKEAISLKNTATSHSYLGNIYAHSGNNKDALNEFDEAISLEPEVYLHYQNKGICLVRLGRNEESLEVLNEELGLLSNIPGKHNGDYFKVFYYLGIANDGCGKYEEAEYCFEKASEYDSTNILNQDWINLEKARKELDKDPHSAEKINIFGNKLYTVFRYEDSREEYKKAIAINPESPVYYANLAGAEYKLGNYDQAIDLLDKALSIKSNNMYAFCRKQVYELEHRKEEEPDNPEVAIQLGRAYIENEDTGKAKEVFAELRKTYPSDELYKDYLLLISLIKEVDGGEVSVARRIELVDKLYESELYRKAEIEARKTINVDSIPEEERAKEYNTLGCVLFNRGKKFSTREDFEEAKSSFEEASKLDPEKSFYKENIETVITMLSGYDN